MPWIHDCECFGPFDWRFVAGVCSSLNSVPQNSCHPEGSECDFIWKWYLCRCSYGSWDEIILGYKSNDWRPCQRRGHRHTNTHTGTRQCEHTGRNWSDVATISGTSTSIRSCNRQVFQTPCLQNYGRRNFCGFKPSRVWYFVMAALQTNSLVLIFLWERRFCIVGKIRYLSSAELF